MPSQTPSQAEQLAEHLLLLLLLPPPLRVGKVLWIGLLYLLPFIGRVLRGILLQQAELLGKAAAAFWETTRLRKKGKRRRLFNMDEREVAGVGTDPASEFGPDSLC